MASIGISACLAGRVCRYDGKSKTIDEMTELARSGDAIIFCPESLGGLPIPRLPAEIVGGNGNDVLDGKAKVVNQAGEDVTSMFVDGAERVLSLLKFNGVTHAYMKERSPSCGVKEIYDGTFSGRIIGGPGVTTALLLRNGITVEVR